MKERIIIFFICAIVIFIALFVFLYDVSFSSDEFELKKIESKHIENETLVYLNNNAVPFIKSKSELDYYFALGYLHSKYRLWQMDILRRASIGELSELFGEEYLPHDKFIRAFELKKIAYAQFDSLDEDTKSILQAYANGVNLFIDNNSEELPIEFSILNYAPKKWLPINSIAIFKLLSIKLNRSLILESINSELSIVLNDEQAEFFSSSMLDNEIVNVSKRFSEFNSNLIKLHKDQKFYFGNINSNVWAVRQSLDSSFTTIIANNLFGSSQIPNLWFQSSGVIKDNSIAGISLPGIPFYLIGRNNNISWGFSNTEVDQFDLFFEKYGSSVDYFIGQEGEYKVKYYKDTIALPNKKEHIYYQRKSKRSVIISDFFDSIINNNESYLDAISFEWAGENIGKELDILYRLSKSDTINSEDDLLNSWNYPSIDLLLADKFGNLNQHYLGIIPKRNSECNPDIISASWQKDEMWFGYYFADDFIQKEPVRNYYSSANAQLIPLYGVNVGNGNYNHYIKHRIDKLISTNDNLNIQEMKFIQNDLYSIHAESMIKKYLSKLEEYDGLLDDYESYVFEAMISWDFILSADSYEATIFSYFLINLIENTFEDELGDELFEKFIFNFDFALNKLDDALHERNHIIFDDKNSKDVENRDYIIYLSFKEAISTLKNKFSSDDISHWKYSEINRFDIKHIFQENDFLSGIINQEEMYLGGNFSTINQSKILKSYSYNQASISNCRYLSDMNSNIIYSALAGGISGNPLSPHFMDQTQIWLNGGYIEINSNEMIDNLKKVIVFSSIPN